MEGWLSLHRRIWDNILSPSAQARSFTEFEAWLYLLSRANHKESKILLDGKVYVIGIGEMITSTSKLAEAFCWGRRKAETLLSLLETEDMISRVKITQKCTRLRISRYADYQQKNDVLCTADDTPDSTTDDTQTINIINTPTVTKNLSDPIKAAVFSVGMELLTSKGMLEPPARSFLGRLISKHDKTAVLDALNITLQANAIEPRAYITKLLQGNQSPGINRMTQSDWNRGGQQGVVL